MKTAITAIIEGKIAQTGTISVEEARALHLMPPRDEDPGPRWKWYPRVHPPICGGVSKLSEQQDFSVSMAVAYKHCGWFGSKDFGLMQKRPWIARICLNKHRRKKHPPLVAEADFETATEAYHWVEDQLEELG